MLSEFLMPSLAGHENREEREWRYQSRNQKTDTKLNITSLSFKIAIPIESRAMKLNRIIAVNVCLKGLHREEAWEVPSCGESSGMVSSEKGVRPEQTHNAGRNSHWGKLTSFVRISKAMQMLQSGLLGEWRQCGFFSRLDMQNIPTDWGEISKRSIVALIL